MDRHFTLLVGSVLGASEYVADAIAEALRTRGYKVTILTQPDIDDIDEDSTWFICTSTHGAGELPDNIRAFAAQLEDEDLNDIEYFVVGLGDSSYDTFCYGAMAMATLMDKGGATLMADPLHIDVLHHPIPEDRAVEWLEPILDTLD
ncbi:FMN-binding protein MioC [uncultured Alteromonas sp.]|jgi:MioC protein|uniref:FMN-binding protein MioC n=1 Tax=uncultured Alteromonas sp. TaxID=179113 RepID=UPI0025FD60A9|nr:FMN-binding protein MioC [uncultured Alteromonas sp.]